MTSGRNVDRTCCLISSTAFSPAAMSTPAAAYVSRSSSGLISAGASPLLDRFDRQLRVAIGFERELRVVVGHGHRVFARETRRAERLGRRTGRRDEAIEVEVRER